MLQVSVPIAHELLAQCIKQGQALIQRASLVGDFSDYESWKAARKQWIDPTVQALEHMYGRARESREFAEAATCPESVKRWQEQYSADLRCVEQAIDLLKVLQGELAFEGPAGAESMPPASAAAELTQGTEASPPAAGTAREDAIDVPAAAARDTSPASFASEGEAEPAEAISPAGPEPGVAATGPEPTAPAATPEPLAPAPMPEPIRREERPFAEPPERLAEPEPARPVGAELTPAQAIGAELAPHDAPGAPAEREEPGAPASAPARTSQVLVAHGRDERWAQAVEHLLDQTGEHEVRVISRRAERGRIVEALGEEAPARYAIVLLTADDVGGPRLESDDEPYFSTRAHQEVVFEMGFLVAALSPGRVCVLYEDGVELPYELDQISHVRLDLAGTWQPKLLLHLRRAGFDYDMNKLAA